MADQRGLRRAEAVEQYGTEHVADVLDEDELDRLAAALDRIDANLRRLMAERPN